MAKAGTIVLGCLLGVLSAPAAASDVELTPLLGTRGGVTLGAEPFGEGSAEADPAESYGLVVDFPVRPDARVEFSVDRQRLEFDGEAPFDLTIDYLQAGSVYEPRRERLRPFVGVALGLTLFDADGARLSDSVGLALSAGGGVKVPLGGRLALRLELRGFATTADTAVLVLCGPGCSVELAADGWFQLAGRIGLAIRL